MDVRPAEAGEESPFLAKIASSVGTDWRRTGEKGPA